MRMMCPVATTTELEYSSCDKSGTSSLSKMLQAEEDDVPWYLRGTAANIWNTERHGMCFDPPPTVAPAHENTHTMLLLCGLLALALLLSLVFAALFEWYCQTAAASYVEVHVRRARKYVRSLPLCKKHRRNRFLAQTRTVFFLLLLTCNPAHASLHMLGDGHGGHGGGNSGSFATMGPVRQTSKGVALPIVTMVFMTMMVGGATATRITEHSCYTELDPETATEMKCQNEGFTGAFANFPDILSCFQN